MYSASTPTYHTLGPPALPCPTHPTSPPPQILVNYFQVISLVRKVNLVFPPPIQ